MRIKRIIAILLVISISVIGFAGCAKNEPKKAEFSEINSICELATLKCYYHNVAKSETEASGFLKIFGVGYKKIWTEYTGIVVLGIDVNKVSVSSPDSKGVVKVKLPDAEILSVDLDEESLGNPLTDSGFLTVITKEEETAALAEAQKNMRETAAANEAMLIQAKERAKNLIEGYIKNVGVLIGEDYTVEWVD